MIETAVMDTMLSDQKNIQIQRWVFVKQQLQSYYNDNIYENWLAGLELVSVDGGKVVIKASSRFVRDWVINNYLTVIRQHWQIVDSNVIAVSVITDNNTVSANLGANEVATVSNHITVENHPKKAEIVNGTLDSKLTFDNFVVGKSNQFAFAAAKAMAAMDNRLEFNPLFFYSPVGHGKTHLIQAIAHEIIQLYPEKNICYLTAERFMFQFVRSLKNKDIITFKEHFRGVDVLIIDDLQFICGKESTQEEFFHTFNTLIEDGKKIILACDRSPNDLEGLDFRFKSRLTSGLVADIAPSDYDLRAKIVEQKAKVQNLSLNKNIIDMLANKITTSIRELEGAINKIAAYSTFLGLKVTLETVEDLLKDLLRASSRSITVQAIQQKIAEYYKIKIGDLSSTSRQREVARPRQLAMFLAKKHTTHSLVEIGKKFGGRDHTTVMHAIKQIEKLITGNSELVNDMVAIERAMAS
ncbi:chromosomal replication initiator protein DnaA [Rickettsiales endosymbiont of Stachyamoeba lipophora]|uniref:chromosomal replication initiator protein DnaA n=1 Tax=Rickettsiales endosymbiont of Stachyamoeba lipophora TaxID=2486578 RepID=UPI000F64C7FD|nr:chromosomal replication initiator protein DnaA [Rickettsiales endosymbiont of Stachyamoeba lipophora]AZL15154.1 chromosomal replication initiator protein DnaA [Rickettsiales endosymbiont of Stachyamoeba lipophora]